MPPPVVKKPNKPKPAAAAMAFLPAALRKRPKAAPAAPATTTTRAATTTTSTTVPLASSSSTTTTTKKNTPPAATREQVPQSSCLPWTIDRQGVVNEETKSTAAPETNPPQASLFAPVSVHATLPTNAAMSLKKSEPIPPTANPPSAAIIIHPEDLYDPELPNDLLQYWERAKAARERVRLEREQAARARQQEELSRAAWQERQALLQAGQYAVLVEKMPPRGRGRGVSNVPAWMLKQQQQQQQQQQSLATNVVPEDDHPTEPANKRMKRDM